MEQLQLLSDSRLGKLLRELPKSLEEFRQTVP